LLFPNIDCVSVARRESLFEKSLHLADVLTWLDKEILDFLLHKQIPDVFFLGSTRTTIFRPRLITARTPVFLPMRRSIAHMKQESLGRLLFYCLSPGSLRQTVSETVHNCLALITTSLCTEFVEFLNYDLTAAEIFKMRDIRSFLRRMIPVITERELQIILLFFELLNNLADSENRILDIWTHGSSWIHHEQNINQILKLFSITVIQVKLLDI